MTNLDLSTDPTDLKQFEIRRQIRQIRQICQILLRQILCE